MRFASVFTGIGGFDEGFLRAGMQTSWQCEADPHCLSVLRYRYPGTKTIEDVKDVAAPIEPTELICGGFPCQDLSVAGRRAGLSGERSGLFHEFMRVVAECSPPPRWVVIENVPGLLSSNEGRDMGIVLGALEELGYGWAYRCLNSQFFGVPQRRRRVFIVGHLGDWRPAAKILFESESVCGNTSPRRKAGEGVAGTAKGGFGKRDYPDPSDGNGRKLTPAPRTYNMGGDGDGETVTCLVGDHLNRPTDYTPCVAFQQNTRDEVRLMRKDGQVAGALSANYGMKQQNYIAFTNRGENTGQKTETLRSDPHGAYPAVAYPIDTRNALRTTEKSKMNRQGAGVGEDGEPAPTLTDVFQPAVAFHTSGYGGQVDKISQPLQASDARLSNQLSGVIEPGMQVRRLTPKECERLQDFSDDWTRWGSTKEGQVKEIADGPRYKMLGNAVTVQVAEWIGRRIMDFERGCDRVFPHTS